MTATQVTDADAAGDRDWFAGNPRFYRRRQDAAGRWWLIWRRRGMMLLRTRGAASVVTLPDRDDALRLAWVDAACPDLAPPTRAALIAQIRKSERARGAR